jgi:RNA polymerase sigma-70 factor (ECF subfamily)
VNASSEVVIEMAAAVESGEFEKLFRAQYSRLARLIRRVVGDAAQAEELASEVLWKFYRKRPESGGSIEGWLTRTALRAALDSLRRQNRRAWYESLWPRPAAPPNPEQELQRDEECARVRLALSSLKARDAELLLLRSEGSSYAEVAAALELNPASIGTLLARAQLNFRKEYVKRYGEQ